MSSSLGKGSAAERARFSPFLKGRTKEGAFHGLLGALEDAVAGLIAPTARKYTEGPSSGIMAANPAAVACPDEITSARLSPFSGSPGASRT